MKKTLHRNYTLHRQQSKAAAKTLMRERNLNEEDLVNTMRVAGDNIKAGMACAEALVDYLQENITHCECFSKMPMQTGRRDVPEREPA